MRVAAGEMVKMPPPAAFWFYLRDAEPYGAGAWRWLARYTKRKQRNTTSPSRTCVSPVSYTHIDVYKRQAVNTLRELQYAGLVEIQKQGCGKPRIGKEWGKEQNGTTRNFAV